MKDRAIPTPTAQRLSLYLRQLEQLARQDIKKVSSKGLAERLHVTAAQVRKDLAHFGQFGRPGVGYSVGPLIDHLRRILGTDHTWRVIVVGMGDLGRALLRYRGFRSRGFDLVGAFDTAPSKIGRKFGDVTVKHIDELPEVLRKHDVRLAVIATPASAAQGVAQLLCQAGIKGILNFAPITLETPPGVAVSSVDLAATLEQLSFQIHAFE